MIHVVLLCSKAWSIQVLAYFHHQNEPRISPIAHYFSASRTSISTALKHLIELNYLKKNSGHGHPLRPAYVLTGKGKAVAEWAAALDNTLEPNDWKLARRTWSLPILRQTIPVSRYGQLRAELSPVTDRALTQSLKSLGENQWLDRVVDIDSAPPSVSYKPTGTGEILVPVLTESLSI